MAQDGLALEHASDELRADAYDADMGDSAVNDTMEFVSEVVSCAKREWAAARLLRICRAYVPALRARKANPEVAFLSLALHAKRRALAYNERKEGSVGFCLVRRIPNTLARIETLVVTRSGRVQFNDGGVTSQLDTVAAISTFLAHHPWALDRLKHVAKYPWGQNYTTGNNYWPNFTNLGVDSTPLELFDDGVVKPALPKVVLLKA